MGQKFSKRVWSVIFAAVFAMASPAAANTLSYFDTVTGTDYAVFGYGGMRDIGTGTVTVSGVSGTVTRAILTWHGPTQTTNTSANATVTFNGTSVTGTNIGLSADNNWGFANSQAYSADVTALVTGNGAYSLADFVKDGGRINVNGVSLEVFYDDGDSTNDRDIVMFHGNDSNIPSIYDPTGWQAVLNGINYSGGPASLVFGVSDGQNFIGGDEAIRLNGNIFVPAGPTWDGNTVPGGLGGPSNGLLWDIRSFDLSTILALGINNLSLTTDPVISDALGLIHLAFNLPAGAAPPPPGVPEPTTMLLFGAAATALAVRRRRASR